MANKEHQANYMRFISAIVAVAILAALFITLPMLRESYQSQIGAEGSTPDGDIRNAAIRTDASPSSDGEGGGDDEVLDAEKLLAEWGNDRNLVPTGNEDEIDPAEDMAENFNDIRIVRRLPQTEDEARRAHDTSRRLACELIPAGEPVLMHNFTRYLTKKDELTAGQGRSAIFSRRNIASIGFDMADADRQTLPSISAGEIMKFLHGNYVSLQVRVEKDPINGTEFLHPRPLATLAQFNLSRLTQPPNKALTASLKNYRGVGMYLPEETEASYESLRTLVMIHRSERKQTLGGGISTITPHYELMFVHGVPNGLGSLQLHVFVTSESRSQLHYIRQEDTPSSPRNCSIVTQLAFTKYAYGGLKPVESVTTGSVLADQNRYSLETLNDYVAQQDLTGGAFGNLTRILNAIVRREIPSTLAARQ